MIVLVCGSRDWTDEGLIAQWLGELPPNTTVLHGDCRGADRIAAKVAKRLGLKVRAFPADWERHGKAAGPLRNRAMLDEGPALVLAFHEDLERSKGTRDCVEEARRRGITVEVIGPLGGAAKAEQGGLFGDVSAPTERQGDEH